MDARQFAYWLQGFTELSGDEPPTPAQWRSIREHLGLVFKKVTPPVAVQPALDEMLRQISVQRPDTGTPMWPPYRVECSSGIIATQIDARTIC